MESVYSCDSLIEHVGEDGDRNNDPYCQRTKDYLDKHFAEMGIPGRDSMQLYADIKVAEVLSRGTRKAFKKLKRTKKRKVMTPEYSEGRKILDEINSTLEKTERSENQNEAFTSIKAMIENEFDEDSVHPIPFERELGLLGNDCIVEVRQLARQLLSSSSESDEANSGSESVDLMSFTKIRLSHPETSQDTPEGTSKSQCLLSSRPTMEPVKSTEEKLHDSSQIPTKRHQWIGKEQERCQELPNPGDMEISKMKIMVLFKEQIYEALNSHVHLMQASQKLMKHRLFRIWVSQQLEGLADMKEDISKRYDHIETKSRNILELNLEKYKLKQLRRNGVEQVCIEKPEGKDKRWGGTLKCIREMEKLLMEKGSHHFLSGVIDKKSKVKIDGSLKKVLPGISSELGIHVPSLHGNKKVMKIISAIMGSTTPLITYGDLLRLLKMGDSFTSEDIDAPHNTEMGIPPNHYSLGRNTNSSSSRKMDSFNESNPDIGCPLLTKREFDEYIRNLNEHVFPTLNFKFIEDLLIFDNDAFVCEARNVLNLNYSLEMLEKDIKAPSMDGPHSRAIYFFQYKAEFTALDVQDAYEQYIHENNAMDMGTNSHPFGCLLLYSNVALGIVMIEGKVLHLFNHFAGFKFSPLHKFIISGQVLYVRENILECFLKQWVSLTIALPPGEITYLTKTKKILRRVAEPRAYHFKEKLHRFYRIISEGKMFEENEKPSDGQSCLIIDPRVFFKSCRCHQINGRIGREEPHVSIVDLLPSPALVMYLLKYKKLKSIDAFIDEYFMQPELDSEDEYYNMVENNVLRNYIDSDDDNYKPKIIKEIKRICKEREIVSKLRREVMENASKERSGLSQPAWIEEYNINDFNPQLVNVEVRKLGDPAHSIVVDHIIDQDGQPKTSNEEKEIELFYASGTLPARRKLINFLETGSEGWQKKLKRFDLTGRQVKEMLRDAEKYKQLKAVIRQGEKMTTDQGETIVERDIKENIVFDVEDKILTVETRSEVSTSEDSEIDEMMEEVEELLEEHEEENYELEVVGGEFLKPYHQSLETKGEFHTRNLSNNYYPRFEWDGESEVEKHLVFDHESGSNKFLTSDYNIEDDSHTEPTSKLLDFEEEEKMPQAPPATSVTDSSTDP